jgi:hypothetical protein
LLLCEEPKIHFSKIDFTFCINSDTSIYDLGICWNETPNPTLFDSFYIFSNSSQRIEYSVKNLSANTTYYFTIFKLYKDGKIDYINQFYRQTEQKLHVGQPYKGGTIAYLFKSGDSLHVEGEQHGIILSIEDLGYASWGMQGQAVEGGTNYKVGFGKSNTQNILKHFEKFGIKSTWNASPSSSSSLKIIHPCAACLCSDYRKDSSEGWFLPSTGDWGLVFKNLDSLTTLNLVHAETYWSSSEVFFSWRWSKKNKSKATKSQFNKAWQTQFSSHALMLNSMRLKSSAARVRAMQYF